MLTACIVPFSGKFGKVWVEVKNSNGINKSVQPRLLQQGEHFIDSYLFQFVVGMVDVATTYISHGSIHRISVDKGKVAKVWHDNLPRLLGEGDHIVESTQFRFEGMESIIANPCIVHGTLTILRVTRGQIALVWKDNEPTFIDIPGLYEFDSPDFTFAEFKDSEAPYIQLGSKKTILVQTGQVGVTYLEGQLKILPNGRHVIDLATHIFNHFLSTQQKSIRLATLNASEKLALKPSASKTSRGKEKDWKASEKPVHPDADLTICETKDLVKVGLRADVFYSIEDPEKCILKIDTDELEDLVRETAVATLTNIIRSTALNQIAQSKAVSAGSESVLSVFQPPGTDGHPPASAPTAIFFERVHDEFLYKLHDDFMHRYGVDIANIRIESFKIMDEELSDQISKHALTTAQIENEMANLEGKALISTTEERTSAEVKIISAEAEAASMKTRTDAENKRKIDAAKALAEAHKISVQAKAEAEAAAILLKAKAEAEAISLKAHAEAQRAELLSKTTLGMQESLLAQYSQMVIESNRGVEKVVYLDPSVNRDSPFALGSLQNLNLDLHSLSQLGVAVDQAGWNGNGNGPVKKGSSSAMVQK
jgi:regulator of protease activity HflC (stomatin/prohibitin superfamily)